MSGENLGDDSLWLGNRDIGFRIGEFGVIRGVIVADRDSGISHFESLIERIGEGISDIAPKLVGRSISSLDFSKGTLTQRFSTENADYEVVTAVHPGRSLVEQRWRISNRECNVSLSLSPEAHVEPLADTGDLMWFKAALPGGGTLVRFVTRTDLSQENPPVLYTIRGAAGGAIVFPKSAQTSELDLLIDFSSSIGPVRHLLTDALGVSHVSWGKYWKTDIEIEGPVEDQQFIRSVMYYLRMSSPDICPPMGTSSETYKGHRFWDAEAWMLPAYAFIDRDAAERITAWRINNSPNGNIPWEAGPKGEDFTDKNFRKAIHQYGWVSWWLERAVILGLAEEKQTRSLQAAITKKFESKSTLRSNQLEFLDVESPDEGLERNNDLVTNLLAERSLKSYPNSYRDALASGKLTVKLPTFEDGLPATYDNDHLNGYQQTAALLAIYPLEAIKDPEVQTRMFDRYKDKTDPSGPAMSDSIHATIAARLNRPDEAYALWRKSWQDFVRPDGLLFSERRNRDVEYFSTGAAGCLQTVLYGFLGLRIEKGVGPLEKNQINLTHGYRLYVRPNLPPAWKSLTFKGIQLPGGNYTIRVTHNDIAITKGG